MCSTGPGSGARDPPASSNSPFWQGKESGRSSYRHQIWGRWPSAGPTEIFGSAEHYHAEVDAMVATGVLRDKGTVYYDARLSHPLSHREWRTSAWTRRPPSSSPR
ncbi:glutamate-cysteine ligase family protein [Streptomyces sp. NPDC005349]|uniref:glutamate-cysteine ligase family protein n=1 Tax=unclassified Streptomyces TaxID=2593676 RepID=UPI0033B2D932